MRIAVVTGEYPTPRAPERAMFVRDQVEALRAHGHQVVVVHHEPPTLRHVVNRVRRRVSAPSASSPRPQATEDRTPPSQRAEWQRRLRVLGRVAHDTTGRAIATRAMVRDLRRLDPPPDVVHAHNTFPAGLAASRFTGTTPIVVTEHSSAFLRRQLTSAELRQAEEVYGSAAAVLAVSPRQAAALPYAAVRVVPNVLPRGFTARHASATKDGDIVSIGTLMRHKGMDVLLWAYAGLPDDLRTRHRLVIVGGGPDAARLQALARELRVEERVCLVGHRRRHEVAEALHRAALVVSASPVETFGMTLVEALAAGVPFVAVRSGGPESIWFPGAGVLVEASAPEEIRGGIERALTTVESPEWSDAHRRAEVVARFGPETIAMRLSEIYREAVSATGVHKAR